MFQNNTWVNGEIQRESILPGEQWKWGASYQIHWDARVSSDKLIVIYVHIKKQQTFPTI